MQHKFSAIITLLVFALLIQNTCLHGFAGRSAVFASWSPCPHKQMHQLPAEGGLSSISSHAPHMPLFVLEMPDPLPVFNLIAAVSPHPVILKSYKDALPKELLRPPQA